MQAMNLGIVRNTLVQKMCIGVFLALLVLPMIGQTMSVGTDVRAVEMRTPAALPAMPANAEELATLPHRFEAWLKDHFGFRNHLVLAYNLIRVKLLGQSTSPVVVLGKNDWLFYSGERSMDQARGIARFTPEELDRWIDVMERRQAWLAERGIPMLMVAIPNKERVYREELPGWVAQVNPESQLDQIRRRLVERGSPLAFMDLTPDLVAAKKDMKVYLKADTHWTVEAAFTVAYTRIMDWIKAEKPNLEPLTAGDVERVLRKRPGNDLDLARMLGLAAVSEEDEIRFKLRKPTLFRTNDASTPGGIALNILKAKRPTAPTVVWFRDSFSISLFPYIADSFRKAVVTEHAGMRFDKALIEQHKPDVVVYQFVERFLNVPIPAE
ncbi:alginate O-acetyltransferase AlgX-related protein [Azospirillum soli]|uniref:alginate O-acetyltransferase AlgX-related protein n=1 Tax=Azospirillum soli TaxID=1304799 RepID=UPI001AE34527|nr:hypothetical protein [Azospirillum soli]MBP2313205.1 hypothetical protein [Azospirillum soli]